MVLSADCLFHFTPKIEYLYSILENEFRPRLSLERLPTIEEYVGALPMVCFCDIPLSQIKRHVREYGPYAIGLTKEWGVRKRLSPVLYTNPGSLAGEALERAMAQALGSGAGGQVNGSMWEALFRVASFVKPYKGKQARPDRQPHGVRFYDEREWRWIPDLPGSELRFGLDESAFGDTEERTRTNQALWDSGPLSFEPSDIRYLIVAKEAEVLPLAKDIKKIKVKYSPDEQLLLATRIISLERALADL